MNKNTIKHHIKITINRVERKEMQGKIKKPKNKNRNTPLFSSGPGLSKGKFLPFLKKKKNKTKIKAQVAIPSYFVPAKKKEERK